jgi:transketolase
MRRLFVDELAKLMEEDERITVILGDLGFGVFDKLRERFPDRCINVGASEQLMIGMSVGMTLVGKITICYSITPFLLYRPFEFIRNYLQEEQIPVKLVGSGRDKDYLSSGFTHYCEEAALILKALPNIKAYFPLDKDQLTHTLKEFIYSPSPAFLSLKK